MTGKGKVKVGHGMRECAFTALMILMAAVLAGCDPAPSDLLLPGTGDRAIASISGTLRVPGLAVPYPPIRVYALRDADPSCTTTSTAIQVLGNHTDPQFSVDNTPEMRRLVGCVWVDSIFLDPRNLVGSPGLFKWKFVTNRSFNSPAEYGQPGDQIDGLEGSVVLKAPFDDGNLVADVITRGPYLAVLNEQRLRYLVLPWTVAPIGEVDRTTGAFVVDRLHNGVYVLVFDGPGVAGRVTQIVVTRDGHIDIGDVVIQRPGGLRGTVSFAGGAPAGRKALVRVLESGSTNIVASDSTSSAWQFTGLTPGDYDVRFGATGYPDTTRTATVLPDTTIDLGNTELRPGFVSQFSRIQVAGNLNEALYGNFDLTRAPNMTQTSPGVWKAVLSGITGGNKLWKFVTNGSFDSPPDYGSDETCRTDLTGSVSLVTGIGTAICVTFPSGTADYEFTLNEQTLTYTIVRQGTAGQGSINGSVTFGATTGPPFPVATIRLQTQAGTTDVGTTTSSATTGAFSFTQLDAGTYKVIAQANCYTAVTVQNIAVTTSAVNVPAILLAAQPSSFSFIQLAGSFNGFDLGTAPRMTQIASCVWADTLMFTSPGAIEFKFVTDGDFDSPTPDYGVPGSQTDPLTGPVVLDAPGDGGNIKVEIPTPGSWRFLLDERFKTYTISAIGTGSPRRPGQ